MEKMGDHVQGVTGRDREHMLRVGSKGAVRMVRMVSRIDIC